MSHRLRIVLIVISCHLLSASSIHAQYLVEEFKPKIKGTPYTAAHVVQDDGKIVLLGNYAFVGDTPVPNVLRFHPDGLLDATFNLGDDLRDQFPTDFRQCCIFADLVLGPGGDLVIMQAGYQRRVTIIDQSGVFKADIATPPGYLQVEDLIRHKDGYVAIVHQTGPSQSIFRLDQNGNVDQAFSRIDYSGHVDRMVVDANNNIILAGNLTIGGTAWNLVRIDEAGALDNSFNHVTFTPSFADIDLFPDGKIVVSSGTEIFLLDENGNKIESFVPETDGQQVFSSVVDPANDRIIVFLEQYPAPVAVKALELDGSVSDAFTPIELGIGTANGLARISHNDQTFVLTAVNALPYSGSVHSFLVFDANGTVDTDISTAEKLFSVGTVSAAVELEEGNLILGGIFTHIGNTQVSHLAKIDRFGNVDEVFAGNNPLSISDHVREIEIASNGQVYVGGFFRDMLGEDVSSLIRIDADGHLDESFVTNLPSVASHSFLDDFIIMPDRIIACGSYSGRVVAFNFDGNTVPTFNTNIFGAQSVSVKSLCKVDDDNFAIGGNVLNGKGFIWIMDQDGNIDNAFVRQDDIPVSSEHMEKVGNQLYRSGSILGGQSSDDANFIYRYNLASGAIDSSKFATYTLSENQHLLALNDSMAVISGEFQQLNNSTAHNFAVRDYDGSAYERFSFQVSPGIVGHYLERTVQLSGDNILLTGRFNNINGEPFYSLAMLHYVNFTPQVNLDETYSIPEDTSFYLTDLIEIIDLDDQVSITVEPNENLTYNESGLVTLRQDFNGAIDLEFTAADAETVVGPFTTTLQIRPVNDAPVISSQVEIPNIVPGDPYEIDFGMLSVTDVDGDELTLMVHEGEGYTLAGGTSILSNEDFSGNLSVGLSVSDGLLTSEVFTFSIVLEHPTGVEGVSSLLFYPNPFVDHIKIDSWENIERVSLRSITGQELINYNHAALKESSGILQAGMVPRGVLVLTVEFKTQPPRHVKLIKK